MDRPFLEGGSSDDVPERFDPQISSDSITMRPPLKKSDHPTFSLMSPRLKASPGPLINESLASFFLDREQGRRTEKFYIHPSYENMEHSRRTSRPFAVPGRQPTPAYVSPSGASLTSLFNIPEDSPTTVSHLVNMRLPPFEPVSVEEARRDIDWREDECLKSRFENVEKVASELPCHPIYDDESALLLPDKPPDLGGFDINKVREKKHLHKCRTAPVLSSIAGAAVAKVDGTADGKKKQIGEVTTTSVIWQASIGLMMYLFVGVMIYVWKREEFKGVETVGWIDALYFCIVTMCTIGYGDITPITPEAKLLSCFLVIVGFGFIDALMSGMVSVVLDRQEDLLRHIVEDGHHDVAKGYVLNEKKGTMRIRLKVFLAISTVLGSILVGTCFLHFVEDLNWIDSVYVTIISITTVGYGDYSFQTMWGRLFAAVWLLLSTLGVARAFLYLAEARVQKRQRHFARRMLERRMTAEDMMDADIDNDGHVSVSEFVVYKLKAMRKIDKTDIVDIVKQFEQMDTAGVGRISMTQLLDWEGERAQCQ